MTEVSVGDLVWSRRHRMLGVVIEIDNKFPNNTWFRLFFWSPKDALDKPRTAWAFMDTWDLVVIPLESD